MHSTTILVQLSRADGGTTFLENVGTASRHGFTSENVRNFGTASERTSYVAVRYMKVHYLLFTNKYWLMALREILTVDCVKQIKRINGPQLGGQTVKGRCE
jgi:hypothetical protein